MKNKFVHSRIFIISALIVTTLLVVATGTYAWFTWSSTDNASLTMTIGKLADVEFVNGNDITATLKPVYNYTDGESTSFRIINKNPSSLLIAYSININITTIPSSLRNTSLKYVLQKNGEIVTEGNFYGSSDGITKKIYSSDLDTETTDYTLYLYIDGNIQNSPNMQNQTLVAELTVIPKPNIEPGDYVSYTPTVTSFTTDISKTGYTYTQTINPSELDTWRVLNINEDGTIDITSEYLSSQKINFKGLVGYQNFVGYLNEIATQYETEGMTISSRSIGYNGQTEYLTDTSMFTYPAPWDSGTAAKEYESLGGGDELSSLDYTNMMYALGKIVATPVGKTETANYWLASRMYLYRNPNRYDWLGKIAHTSNLTSGAYLYGYTSGDFKSHSASAHLRPVVTLSSELLYEGLGTQTSPWTIVD